MVVETLLHWSNHIIMAIPLLFFGPMVYIGNRPMLCAYVMLWMAIYWVSAALPLGVTSLMPVVLFPVLGILTTEETTTSYFNEVGAVFLGSMIFVAALNESGLAKRVGLRMLHALGTSNSSLLLAFILSTGLLSMSLPNTASTAVVAPVVMAVVEQMRCRTRLKRFLTMLLFVKVVFSRYCAGDGTPSSGYISPRPVAYAYKRAEDKLRASLSGLNDESLKDLRRELMMSVAYASSIGGMATTVGTPGNMIMRNLYEKRFPGAPIITSEMWMSANVPIAVICLLFAWAWSSWRLRHLTSEVKEESKTTQDKIEREVEQRYLALGRMRSDEITVLLMLTLLVYLWLFKSREHILSWTNLRPADAKVSLTTSMLMACIPLFIVPRSRQLEAVHNPLMPFDPILKWHEVAPKCHWNLMFLLSGSLTFSKAAQLNRAFASTALATHQAEKFRVEKFQASLQAISFESARDDMLTDVVVLASGLSDLIAEGLLQLEGFNYILVVTALCLLASAMTSVFSNAAVSAILTPVVLDMAVKLRMHPLSLAMPVTLACSFAFMLPASTPPNALVYEMAGMGVRDMIWPGSVMVIVCIIVCILLTFFWGRYVLDVGEFPQWAADNASSVTPAVK